MFIKLGLENGHYGGEEEGIYGCEGVVSERWEEWGVSQIDHYN